MITLYEKDATFEDWDDSSHTRHNGLCVLSPTSCIVTEVAGGEYELEMEHPLDENKKYMMLTEERLIKAPIPVTIIPETTMPALVEWTITTATSLYSKTPVTKVNTKYSTKITDIINHPSNYVYHPGFVYNAGTFVLMGGLYVYMAKKPNLRIMPGTDSSVWEYVWNISNPLTSYDGGTVIESLSVGDVIYKVASVDGSYIKVRVRASGKVGFVLRSACQETQTQQQQTLQEKTIKHQVFRIYETSCDEETNTYSVKARHISYDFAANCLYGCKVEEREPNEAIATIQSALMKDDSRTIACNITGTKVTKDWSFKNPVNALLDPDNGLVKALSAKLVRDNNDFYILKPDNPRQGITIAYGMNMLGVNWSRSIENVITRVVPRSGNSDKGYKYISDGGKLIQDQQTSEWSVRNDGKVYVRSSIEDEYAIPRIAVLNCSYTVGQEYVNAEGTKVKYTESEVLAKMKEDAMKEFTEKGVDGVDITLDVEFLLLGDTDEFQQYKDLQTVCLYDVVKVKTGKSQIDATAQVTEYEYDCIRKRYNSIKLGKVNSFSRRIPGYRVVNESVTYEKLSPDLINRILTDNASASSDSNSEGTSQTSTLPEYIINSKDDAGIVKKGSDSSGNQVWMTNGNKEPDWRTLPANTATQDGIVTKGGTNYNKVWKTDGSGVPGWREDSSGSRTFTVDNLLSATGVTTSATYSSTGKTFTMDKFGLVRISMSYGSGRPVAIGCKLSASASSASSLLTAIDPSAIEDTSGLTVSGLLFAGTYYVWCKTAIAGSTNITVDVVYFND